LKGEERGRERSEVAVDKIRSDVKQEDMAVEDSKGALPLHRGGRVEENTTQHNTKQSTQSKQIKRGEHVVVIKFAGRSTSFFLTTYLTC
jgi:hypothetical protein